MDKFMPKTIEQLNAEFEARMEKAKQDELNAAAEKAAALNLAPLGVEAPPRAAPKAAMRRAPMKASGKSTQSLSFPSKSLARSFPARSRLSQEANGTREVVAS